MAYSGYFGYFIGLSVIRPAQRWKILLIGLLSASIPHALWDSVLSLDMAPLSAASALLSYVVLAAAILKAREISPNHSLLQPSIIFGGAQTSGAQAASYRPAVPVQSAPPPPPPVVPTPVAPRVPVPPQPPPARMATIVEPHPSLSAPAREGGNRLRVGTRYLAIMPGLRLLEHQVPGLEASSPGGLVAEVTRNPNEPSILGLTNLSTSEWEVVSASGARRQIVTGQTIRLALGTKIDFGSTDGEVG
jgi:PrsW family intramembrane metalloprotease